MLGENSLNPKRSIIFLKHGIVQFIALAAIANLFPNLAHAETETVQKQDADSASPAEKARDIEFVPLASAKEYKSIDGKKIHRDVIQLAEISRRYRDSGHPKFWGRITGTSADHETTRWLADKFTSIGLTDVHIQPLDLPPQWFPNEWRVTISTGAQTAELESAQPFYQANGLPSGGVELEAVYAGLGAEADFAGKDVNGKAVFVYNMLGVERGHSEAVKLADSKGASLVFDVSMLPGNMRFQQYPSGTKATAFSLGNEDGAKVREIIASAKSPPKITARLNAEYVANLQTGIVWGTLPGQSDERVYIIAHTDGWFDASGDNASGVASMIALAEYYSKLPRSKRRRTLVFIGLDGHHNGSNGGVGRHWLVEHKDTLFPPEKTALMINLEHPSTIMAQPRPRYYPGESIVLSNTLLPMQWYGGGERRPKLKAIVWGAFLKSGVPLNLESNKKPPAGDLTPFSGFLPGVTATEFHVYFHTDQETPQTVPWTGLEGATRAFARIIDEVNELPIDALREEQD